MGVERGKQIFAGISPVCANDTARTAATADADGKFTDKPPVIDNRMGISCH